MASYYSRSSLHNLRLPGHYRLYPYQEPHFDAPLETLPERRQVREQPPASAESNAEAERAEPASLVTRSIPSAMNTVAHPPPAYRGAGLPLVRTTSSGATLVNPRRSRAAKLEYQYHPALAGPNLFFKRTWRFLTREREILSSDFPEDFDELLEYGGGATEEDANKIRELYRARVEYINQVVPQFLVITRLFMAFLEVIDFAIVCFFIAALAVTKGRQEGLLEAGEVALILVILVTAGLLNHVRVRRWQLRRILRNLSRDWSPLPTSSTAADLVQAYLGAAGDDPEAAAALRGAQAEGLKPCMRWTMVQKEGSFWTSYRPIVMVELIVPNAAQGPPPPHPAQTGEDWVPTYAEDIPTGERVVQFVT